MKRVVVLALLALGILWTLPSNASCQTVKFLNGERFCFDIEKKSDTLFEAKTSQKNIYSPGFSCNLLLPNNTSVYLPACEGTFSYAGIGTHIVLKAEIQNYTASLVTNYYFAHGSFDPQGPGTGTGTNPVVTPENNQIIYYDIDPLLPKKNEWISLWLKVINSGGVINPNFTQKVTFSVEEFRDGVWKAAYSSDYDLSRTSYTFTSSNQGKVYLNQLIRFKKASKFRLVSKIGTTPFYQTFKIGESTVIVADNVLHFVNVSTTSPTVNTWVNLGLEIRRDGVINTSFNQKVTFSVEEFRDGSWKPAHSSDYTLSRSSYTFTTANAGKVHFNNFLKFFTQGTFRLVAQTEGKTYSLNFYPKWDAVAATYEVRVYDLSTTSPQIDEWVTMHFRAYKNGSRDRYYTQKVFFSVEEYRNGVWRPADDSDYHLLKTAYTFNLSDEGELQSDKFLRFYSQGTFRLVISGPGFSTKQEFAVRKSSSGSSTSTQARKLEIVRIKQ